MRRKAPVALTEDVEFCFPSNLFESKSRSVSMSERIAKKFDLVPQKRHSSHSAYSIGFSKKNKKWYGWSHRAICGFGIGDKLFDEKMPGATDKTPFVKHGKITIKTLDQARQAAENFAASVS